MDDKVLAAGIVCIIGAIVGGGLKAFQIELPIVNSRGRQILLGVVGIVFVLYSRTLGGPQLSPPVAQGASIEDQDALLSMIDEGCVPFRWNQNKVASLPPLVTERLNGRFARIAGGRVDLVGNLEQGTGAEAYARKLAEHRAQLVQNLLRERGLDADFLLRTAGLDPKVPRYKDYFCGVIVDARLNPPIP